MIITFEIEVYDMLKKLFSSKVICDKREELILENPFIIYVNVKNEKVGHWYTILLM